MLTRVDKDALRRAMRMAKAEGRKEQLIAKLKEESWEDVAMFAAFVCQMRNLHLKPWECPPAHAGPTTDTRGRDYENDPKAIAMKQRLIDAGLSIFEPDPPGALARVEARAHGDLPPAAA